MLLAAARHPPLFRSSGAVCAHLNYDLWDYSDFHD